MKLTKLILGTAAIGGLGHLAAKGIADKLQRNPDPWQLSELLHPTPGDEVVVERDDGTLLHSKVAGDGPTVMLAHGYGFNLGEWNLVAERLVAGGRRVITFDQRGHGRSTIGAEGLGSPQMAGDYAAVLEHHGVRDAVLVGHSMGTFLSMKFCLQHPDIARDRLKGMVLVSPLAGKANEGAPQNQLQIPLIKVGAFDAII
ncbi:MAG: alpha/beta hydrolase, partial [Acidimicrobiia bacterium]|nr:alpha/beta hydrolase [Acidimicrobiia bacterium]